MTDATRRTLFAIAILASALPAPAQERNSGTDVPIEEIIVTGSNIQRSTTRSARPVDVVSREAIAAKGPLKFIEALRDVPAFNGAAAVAGQGPGADGRSTVNLRGLGDAYTLVLVNGRRFSSVRPANINEVPSVAVTGVEILKDGSSSIYGSDAVAGVVNILLDKQFEGLAFDLAYGNALGGYDAKKVDAAVKFGIGTDRARFVANFTYSESNETKVTDTELGSIPNRADLGGIEQDRYFTNPANIVLPDGSRVILDYNRFGPGEFSLDPADFIPYDPYDYNRSAYSAEERALFTDHAPERQVGTFLYGEYDLVPETLTLFGEGLFTSGHIRTQYVTWGLDFYGDPVLDFGPIPADHPYNPFGAELRAVNYAVAEVGTYIEDYYTDTYRVVGGFRGDFGRYSYEVGATRFESEELYNAHNLYSSRGLLEAINRPGDDAFNPFGNMANTAEQIAGIRIPNNEFTSTSTQTILDARVTGVLRETEAYSLDFAVGAETRNEEYESEVDPLTATGDVYYYQSSPDFQGRRSDAAFAELAYTLQGDEVGVPAVHRLTVEMSGRYESIEDVGDTFNPRLAASWQPFSDRLTLRASFGRSFKAPPIDLLRAEQRLVNEVLYYPGLDETLPTDLLVGGNPDLEPETAESMNLGVVLRIGETNSLLATIDYFNIDQKDVVLVPSGADIVEGLFPGEIDFSGARPRIEALPTNVAGRKVEGIDASLTYDIDTAGAGLWSLHGAGSYLTRFDADNGAGYTSFLGQYGRYGRPTEFGSLPRFRGLASVEWRPTDRTTASLSTSYVHHFDDIGVERQVDSFMTSDLQLVYDPSWDAFGLEAPRIRIGILNLTDKEPPFVNGAGYPRYDSSTANSRRRTYFISFSGGL